MSRTLRIKHFEKIRPLQSNKTHGYYGQYDESVRTENGHGGYWTTRAPTYQEYRKEFWCYHGESKHSAARGPSRFYVNPVNRRLRRNGQEQIRKWLLNPQEVEIIHFYKRDQWRAWYMW